MRLDDEFVLAAPVREPSHRDRRRQARKTRWQARRAAVSRRLPTLPEVPERFRPSPRQAVAVALLVALGAGVFVLTRGGGDASTSDQADVDTAVAAALREFRAAADNATAVTPFAATPAAAFADGEAGIVMPEAAPAAPFTTEDVDAALRHVRRLLITANLDPDVVMRSKVTPVARLLGPRTATRLETVVDQPTPDLSASGFLTRFPPETALSGPAVKVTGTIRVAGVDDGRLQIATEHLFVYATRPIDAVGVAPSLILVRRSHVWEFEQTAGGVAPPELVGGDGSWSNGQCLENDRGYIWPPFVAAPGYEHPRTIAPPDLWDLDAPLPDQRGCPA